MHFTKMQGCGNDYVYLDCFAQKLPANAAALASKISDRHFGVGSDGATMTLPDFVCPKGDDFVGRAGVWLAARRPCWGFKQTTL